MDSWTTTNTTTAISRSIPLHGMNSVNMLSHATAVVVVPGGVGGGAVRGGGALPAPYRLGGNRESLSPVSLRSVYSTLGRKDVSGLDGRHVSPSLTRQIVLPPCETRSAEQDGPLSSAGGGGVYSGPAYWGRRHSDHLKNRTTLEPGYETY